MTSTDNLTESLRAGLLALADETVSADLRADARRTARRIRRTRGTAGALAVAALAAGGAGLAVAVWPPPPATTDVGGPIATTPPTAGPTPTPTVARGSRAIQLGPSHPAVGITYDFDLFVHCGLKYARFGGRTWKVSQSDNRYGDGQGNYLVGTMTLVDETTARFEFAGHAWVFRPTTDEIPPCD